MTELAQTFIERFVNGSWNDISDFVVGDITIEYLISSNRDDDKLASVGMAKMLMDNESGSFTPNSNFHRGTLVRVRTVYNETSKTRFVGTILGIEPDTYDWGDQYVQITVVDWLHAALNFPADTAELQTDLTADEAVAYLLSLMEVQPQSVEYHEGTSTFDFTFSTIKEQTKAYSELNKLALSEFAPIYLKGNGTLVVESFDTRHGQRELTQVPVVPSSLYLILTDPNTVNGRAILIADGSGMAILADRTSAPNLVSGSYQPFEIKLEPEPTLFNQVEITAYPTRTDPSPVKLFQLDVPINFAPNMRQTIKGRWANPDGGGAINAFDIVTPLITGTNYTFTNFPNTQDVSTTLFNLSWFRSSTYNIQFFATRYGVLRRLDIYGRGIYPYNPISAEVGITGSFSQYGIFRMDIDQKYQDDFNLSQRVAEMIAEDNKDPQNRLVSVSFDASLSPELMQASQYMDSGDLTWVKNPKNSLDTYAYIRGKKTVIAPQGWITETWYLKEADVVRKGLSPIGLRFNKDGRVASENVVDFGAHPNFGTGARYTWMGKFYFVGASTSSLISMAEESDEGVFENDLFLNASHVPGVYNGNSIQIRRRYDNGVGARWQTASGSMTPYLNQWVHIAMAFDTTNYRNAPELYINGNLTALENPAPPTGGVGSDISQNKLLIGNISVESDDLAYNLKAIVKDVRIYAERKLEDWEIRTIALSNTYTTVPNGLSFHTPFVKTEDYGNFTGTILYPDMKIIDAQYGVRGTPSWHFPSGTAFALRAWGTEI